MFNFTVPITKDYILKRVSEEEIFRRYLGIAPDYTNTFCNPLREDTSPGCGFYVDKFDRIKFKDHSWGFNWDCFNVVEYLYKTDFKGAMIRVATDFGLLETGGHVVDVVAQRIIRKKDKLGLRIKKRDWVKIDKEIWFDRYYQTRNDLHFHDTFPISHAWYERNGILEPFYDFSKSPNQPGYAYCFGGFDYKLYFPLQQKDKKFRQSRGDIIQGLNQLPETGHILIITKSMKDVMCINKLGKDLGIYAIAPMSETQMINVDLVENLKTRFDYIFTLFDFDRAGILLKQKYEREFDIPFFFFGPSYRGGKFSVINGGIKDFADHLHIRRKEETIALIHRMYEEHINS